MDRSDGAKTTLAEFQRLPDVVDIQVPLTARNRDYLAVRPELRVGGALTDDYAVVYLRESEVERTAADLGGDLFGYFPKIMSPTDVRADAAAGITPLTVTPFPGLSGRGVMIGFVDTGVDYTLPCFAFSDGRSKIVGLWDQTVDGPRRDGVYFGSTYGREDIDRALAAPDPRAVVPSWDEDGHGTFLASVAAGCGSAPGAYIGAVRMRRARRYYIDRYLLSHDDPALYESTDFLLGVRYLLDLARENGLPAVICVGMGSNMSAHDGNTLLEDFTSFYSGVTGRAFVCAAGNEANTRRHAQGRLSDGGAEEIEIRVPDDGASFTCAVFTAAFDAVSVSVASPTGTLLAPTPLRGATAITRSSPFEAGSVSLRFYRDVNNDLIVGFDNAAAGIWRLTLYGDAIVDGGYQAWLPVTGQAPPGVEFLRPDPACTVVFPATAMRTMTCGAYDTRAGSLYAASSRGPTALPRIAPDFVAPGVAIAGLYPYGEGVMTGTSAAAAVAAGAVALLFEWGLVRGNMPSLNGDVARSLLIAGCRRDSGVAWPDARWGYGKIDLYNSFRSMLV